MTNETSSSFPSFFQGAPTIRVHDPLATFLGAGDGFIEYGYADAVKLAGHSCPTVASAFLMTRAALAALYPDAVPSRGDLRVELREPMEEGVTGVIGNVAALITGAAGEGGFHGIGGRFVRRDRLAFGVAMEPQLRFTRLDSGAAVGVAAPAAVDAALRDGRGQRGGAGPVRLPVAGTRPPAAPGACRRSRDHRREPRGDRAWLMPRLRSSSNRFSARRTGTAS